MTPNKSPHDEHHAESFGLVANGSVGSWDVDLDESLTDADRWFLQIQGPRCYLHFQIEQPAIVENAVRFLEQVLAGTREASTRQTPPGCEELELSCHGANRVSLLWDRGSNDRCLVSISGDAHLHVQIPIECRKIQDLLGALNQLREDLIEDGLLAATSDQANHVHSD